MTDFQIRQAAYAAALAQMDDDTRADIEGMAAWLVDVMHANHPCVQFSPDAALETIAAVGMFLARKGATK